MESFLVKENIDYKIYNHGYTTTNAVVATNKKWFWYIRMLFLKRHSVFHFHQFFVFHFIYFFIFSILRKEKIIVTIHSERILTYSKLKRFFILFFIRNTRRLKLISVSKNLSEYLKHNDITSVFLPAYVPPCSVNKKKIISSKKIILFSVWKFNEELANQIYNVPLAFEYLSNNKEHYEMLFMIGNKSDSDEKYLQQLIDKYSIESSIKIVYNENLIDYLNNCYLLLRPNLSDGYGVSLQEALDLGVPAVASNVCQRPKGTILFENNNIKDLTIKIELIKEVPLAKILEQKETLNYHLRLIDIYKSSVF
jgi:glycosyltransferase involved in cell wall biosynthesis